MKLYDTQPNPPKAKNVSPLRVIVNKWGFLLGSLMLGLGVIVGLAVAVFALPPLLSFDITATALAEREIMLAATDADLNQRDRDAIERETQFALDRQATQLALSNAEALLNQTATQSVRNIIATTTANAAENARQRTQIALDYEATQVQLQRNATQVQIDFQNTEAALEGQSGGFQSQSGMVVTIAPTATATPIPPTPTSTVTIQPPTDTPVPSPTPLRIETDFRNGLDFDDWYVSCCQLEDFWQEDRRGAKAIAPVGLLTREADWEDDYTITLEIAPAAVVRSTYTIVLSWDFPDVVAVQMDTTGFATDSVRLIQYTADEDDTIVVVDDTVTVLTEFVVDEPLTSDTRFEATVENGIVTVHLNDTEILSADLPDDATAGQVGAILPPDTILQTIRVQQH